MVEYLIESTCVHGRNIYDPFCGSGTVLFEALQQGKDAVGMEVNPAAWHLASLASFSSLATAEKAFTLSHLRALVSKYSSSTAKPPAPTRLISDCEDHQFLRLAVAASILLGMGNNDSLSPSHLVKGGFATITVLNELEKRSGDAMCLLGDARQSSLKPQSVDAVITSPPYINVFNYHQNYRPAIEQLGWLPLQAAKSEIGANRKHRGNRFLTVVQYCIDMRASLMETSRLMRCDAPLVIVLGRTSKVLGVSFRNGELILKLLNSTGCFRLEETAQRSFKNRFGELIFEDIFVCRKLATPNPSALTATEIGVEELELGFRGVSESNRHLLEDAVAGAHLVKASPILNVTVPAAFSPTQQGQKWK